MIVKIEINTEGNIADSRFSVRPILSDQEMKKVRAAADELGVSVANVLLVMNTIVYNTFYTQVGMRCDELTFDGLLEGTKDGFKFTKGEEHDSSK